LTALPFGYYLSFIWFSLLFIAAFTSSLALIQPLVALFEDELNFSHSRAVNLSMIMVPIGAFLSAFVPKFLDELDFWAGTMFLIIFSFIEILAFVWLFGVENFYKELTRDVFLKIPKAFVYIFYGTSAIFIGVLFYFWTVTKLPEYLGELSWNLIVSRGFIVASILLIGLIAIESKRRNFI